MTDAFVLVYVPEYNHIRYGMAYTVLSIWKDYPGDIDRCAIVSDCTEWEAQSRHLIIPHKNFHIESKRLAERRAESKIYVVADDDCLILGKEFVERGVKIMERHPQYGLLAAANICEGDFRIDWQNMPEVVERDIVGGIAFVRKGILTKFKSCTPPEVDRVICDEIRSKGYKTGIMPSVRFNHIGAGYSISNPNYWMSVPS